MTDLTGFDYSSGIITTLEKRLNEKGIVILNTEADTDGTRVYTQGMANRFLADVFVPKMPDQPDETTSKALITEYMEDIEAGLRRGVTERTDE